MVPNLNRLEPALIQLFTASVLVVGYEYRLGNKLTIEVPTLKLTHSKLIITDFSYRFAYAKYLIRWWFIWSNEVGGMEFSNWVMKTTLTMSNP